MSLQPLSRDHHHGLLLCWKIRQGMKNGIDVHRIKKYCNWFWESHLEHHFEIEEQHVFPLLPPNNEMVKKAIAEHRRLKRLFEKNTDLLKTLNNIEEGLQKHIRFEERVLFNEIQQLATVEQLSMIINYTIESHFS